MATLDRGSFLALSPLGGRNTGVRVAELGVMWLAGLLSLCMEKRSICTRGLKVG